MNKLFGRPLCILIGCYAAGLCNAETVKWFSDAQQVNQTSAGSAMDGGFSFELGVFNSFVPTASNISQWAQKWVPAKRTNYDPVSKRFVDQFAVTGNTAPFSINAKAYIWGFRNGSSGSEWILFRSNTWNWPAPNLMNPLGPEWNAASADEVFLGTINSSGLPFLMKSAAVSSYAQWTVADLTGEAENAPSQDPDNDGTSNLLEFVFGSPPKVAGAPPATPVAMVESNGQKFLQITVPRRKDRLAMLTVEVSGNLVQWNSGSAHTTVVQDDAVTLVVRDLTPIDALQPTRFMRLKASLP